jgi:hypothetical protein
LIRQCKYLEGEQIKRGTLVEEFLYLFFFREPFFLMECKFPHGDQITESLSGAKPTESDYLCFKLFSSETVSFLRPLRLREANTLRPFAEAILSRKPCLFFLFLRDG